MTKGAEFRRKKKPRDRSRHSARRPYMIDAEEFDFMDDCEMYDWMYGNPTEGTQ
jgi:hypothetical protein